MSAEKTLLNRKEIDLLFTNLFQNYFGCNKITSKNIFSFPKSSSSLYWKVNILNTPFAVVLYTETDSEISSNENEWLSEILNIIAAKIARLLSNSHHPVDISTPLLDSELKGELIFPGKKVTLKSGLTFYIFITLENKKK